MNLLLRLRCVLGFAAVAVWWTARGSAVAWAHGDFNLFDDGGQVGVQAIDDVTEVVEPGVRAFEAVLLAEALPFSPFNFSASDPGFDSLAGQLPAQAAVSINVLSLDRWNGADFAPVSAVAFGFDGAANLATGAQGELHEHLLFGLADLTADPVIDVPDGVYLARLSADVAGLATSEPFCLVMLKDDLIADVDDVEQLEALLEAYEAGGPEPILGGKNFAFFEEAVEAAAAEKVPEPATAILAAAGIALDMARRRGTSAGGRIKETAG